MQPADQPPPYLLKEPLIPEHVAEELPALLIEIRDRWQSLKSRGSGTAASAVGGGRLKLDIATRVVLEELDHCFKLATDRGHQLSARRWESLLNDLRNLKRKLDGES
jgi:hypothetical protein